MENEDLKSTLNRHQEQKTADDKRYLQLERENGALFATIDDLEAKVKKCFCRVCVVFFHVFIFPRYIIFFIYQ
jgi:hypothetical protein